MIVRALIVITLLFPLYSYSSTDGCFQRLASAIKKGVENSFIVKGVENHLDKQYRRGQIKRMAKEIRKNVALVKEDGVKGSLLAFKLLIAERRANQILKASNKMKVNELDEALKVVTGIMHQLDRDYLAISDKVN